MKRTLLTLATITMATAAMALAGFTGVFGKTYSIAKDSNLGKANCAVCHTSSKGGKLNAYGNDLKKAMKSEKKLTAAHLKAVEGLDSNKNGKSNITDIKADVNPGL